MLNFLIFIFLFIFVFALIFILFVVGMLRNIFLSPFRRRENRRTFRQTMEEGDTETSFGPDTKVKSRPNPSKGKFDKSNGQYVDFEDIPSES